MDIVTICQKAQVSLEDGEKVKQMIEARLEQEFGQPFNSFLTKTKSPVEWLKLGLFLRDMCRGPSNDCISIFLTNYLLPPYYRELGKVEKSVNILKEIKDKEKFNPRVWTLKYMATDIQINIQKMTEKLQVLKNNHSLNKNYQFGIKEDQTIDILENGKVIDNKIGLFLGSMISDQNQTIWKWLTSPGPIPPIDLDMIADYLPEIYQKDTLQIDNDNLWCLLACLAIIFDFGEVQLITISSTEKVKICVGLKNK